MLKNITKGWELSVDTIDEGFTSLADHGQGVIFIEEYGGSDAPLPRFNPNTILFGPTFSINGSTLASLTHAPGLECFNLFRNDGTILGQTSQINEWGFQVTWKHE